MNGTVWFAEAFGENLKIQYLADKHIYSGRSKYQTIDIVDTEEYGRMLFLDGVAQSSDKGEFIYHEVMVHPAMLTHPNPQTVCIIGGAEGATLREVFRHPSVTRAIMVDVDEELVGLCKKYLPRWNAGAYDDPRLDLRFGDGRQFLEQTTESYDLSLIHI